MSMTDNRFRVYELLFSKPLYAYAKRTSAGLRNDVLILGSGSIGTEAFKAVYWCGQYAINNELNITVASADVWNFRAGLSDTMPALSAFRHFADIECIQVDDLTAPGALSALNFDWRDYDYVIIALGNNSSNYRVAESVRQLMADPSAGSGKAIISIFDETGGAPFSEQTVLSPNSGRQLTVCSFGNGMSTQEEYQTAKAKFRRLASNIDFTYAMEQDQRVSKTEVAARFHSDPYYSESSYACAVHIPYKLAMCNDFQGNDEQNLHTLIEAVATENSLYNKLIAVEHRRWVAYMVVSGYAPPTRQQLEEYAFIPPHNHRNKELKLHPCMCACDLTGRHLDEHYDLWDADEKRWSTLAELDRVSLLLHRLAAKRAAPVCANMSDYFSFISNVTHSTDTVCYETLRLSALKLCSDEENSIRLYQEALEDAMHTAERRGDVDVIQQLRKIEQDFSVVVSRNQRADHFANNAALVNRLPFCLWYGEQYKSVITFTKGLLCDDIILPTLLSAEKAVFVGNLPEDSHYRAAAAQYFEGRGGNTKVITRHFQHNGVADIVSFLTELVTQHEAPVINCVDCDDPEIFIAIGTVASKLAIPAVRYEAGKGIIPILNTTSIGLRLVDKSLSIDEFTNLMGGEYRNVYANVSSIGDYENFSRIFWEYSKERSYWTPGRNGQGKTTFSSPWSSLSSFFQASSKDEIPYFTPQDIVPPQRYSGTFHPKVFRQCDIGHFLEGLNAFHIIKDLTHKKQDGFELVQFTYVDRMMEIMLSTFESGQTAAPANMERCLRRKLKFNPAFGIAISDLQADNVSLLDPLESTKVKQDKREFLDELHTYGMIHSVRFSPDGQKVSFTFKDEHIQHLFKTQGKIFELIIYYGLKNSGLFHDVQTSVQIAWEANSKSFETLLRERLDADNRFGFIHFHQQQEILKDDTFKGTVLMSTDNEIDVVAMLGMHPIFISCKTGKKGGNDWLHEISSISNHFHAQPVLAVMKNLDGSASAAFVLRARKMGVSLIGIETVSDSKRFQYAIKEIAAGRTVYGPDTRRQI